MKIFGFLSPLRNSSFVQKPSATLRKDTKFISPATYFAGYIGYDTVLYIDTFYSVTNALTPIDKC